MPSLTELADQLGVAGVATTDVGGADPIVYEVDPGGPGTEDFTHDPGPIEQPLPVIGETSS